MTFAKASLAGGLMSYGVEFAEQLSATWSLCWPHSEGRKRVRFTGHASGHIRFRHQPCDRQGARPRRAAASAARADEVIE